MKNYYLKRIDELRTDIGSDSRPTPVATVSRIAAGATYPALKKGAQLAKKAKQTLKLPFEDLKGDVKDALQKRLEKLKRKKNNPQRVDRLKAAEKKRKFRRELKPSRNERVKRALNVSKQRELMAKSVRPIDTGEKGEEIKRKAQEVASKEARRQEKLDKYKIEHSLAYTQIGYILAESLDLL